MPTEETRNVQATAQEAHDTGADEWVAMPTGPGCILGTMEQVPWEGLGQGSMQSTRHFQTITLISGTEWMETAL